MIELWTWLMATSKRNDAQLRTTPVAVGAPPDEADSPKGKGR
jgi:hypothetical protein